MTRDEIIEMAIQAGCFEKHQVFYFTSPELEAFAKLVAQQAQAEERDECLKFCDQVADFFPSSGFVGSYIGSKIRARGDNK